MNTHALWVTLWEFVQIIQGTCVKMSPQQCVSYTNVPATCVNLSPHYNLRLDSKCYEKFWVGRVTGTTYFFRTDECLLNVLSILHQVLVSFTCISFFMIEDLIVLKVILQNLSKVCAK